MASIAVSIIIPVYNREFELKRAVESVLKQTIQNFEIIVVDDFSQVDIKAIVESFEDLRILYFRLPKKGNANVSRNLGIAAAKGEYIAMLDSDDEWLPNHLEAKIKFIEENKLDGAFGGCFIDNGESKSKIIARPLKENELMVNYLLSDGIAVTPSHVYKTIYAKQVLWDETLNRHQDLDFSVRFANQFKFQPSCDISCIVHWKKGETRSTDLDSQIKFIEKNKNAIDSNIYSSYHRIIFSKIRDRKDVDIKFKKHYLLESTKNIKILSLTDFLSCYGNNLSVFKRLYLRFIFVVRVILS